jgi:hypothetical protein
LCIDGANGVAGRHIIGDKGVDAGWSLTREADVAAASANLPGSAVLRLTVGYGGGVPDDDTLDLEIPQAMWGRPLPVFAGRIAGDLALGIVGDSLLQATPTDVYTPNGGTVSVGYDVNAGSAALTRVTIFEAAYYQSGSAPGLADILAAGSLQFGEQLDSNIWSLNRLFQANNYVSTGPNSNTDIPERLTGAAAALGAGTLVTNGMTVVTRVMTP